MHRPVGMVAAVAVSAVALVSCSRKDESKAHAGDGGMAMTTATATAAVETAASGPTTITVSAATFTKDTLLDECVDFLFPLPEGTDASVSDAADRFAKVFIGNGKKNTKSRIYKPCAEQFRTSAALATCTAQLSLPLTKADAAPVRTLKIDSVERYYNLDNLTQSNAYMKDCLDMKGDWQMVDKDSDAYREAVRARARRNIEKGLKALGQ